MEPVDAPEVSPLRRSSRLDGAGSPAGAAGRTGLVSAGPPRHRTRPVWQRPRILLAVAAGGIVGASARYELGLALATRPGTFPVSTFVINLTGSFFLGLTLTVILDRWRPTEYVRPFVATGVLGAYTTWSTFMVETDNLARKGHVAVAAAYAAASLAGGLAAVYAGILLARGRPPVHVRREGHGGSK